MWKYYGEQKESHKVDMLNVKNDLCPYLVTSSDAHWEKKHHNFLTQYPRWLAVLYSGKCRLRDSQIIYFYKLTVVVCYLWCCLKHIILQILI